VNRRHGRCQIGWTSDKHHIAARFLRRSIGIDAVDIVSHMDAFPSSSLRALRLPVRGCTRGVGLAKPLWLNFLLRRDIFWAHLSANKQAASFRTVCRGSFSREREICAFTFAVRSRHASTTAPRAQNCAPPYQQLRSRRGTISSVLMHAHFTVLLHALPSLRCACCLSYAHSALSQKERVSA